MIKIITNNGVEIPYLKETLSIKEVNNSFTDSFYLAHTEFPFIVIENEDVIRELGSSEVNSLTSKKEIDITFINGPKVYFGKLKVLKYLKNRRSCVLKFSNELIKIFDKKISDFMPIYKYNGEIPYTESVEEWFNQEDFIDAINTDINKMYPDVDYAAPILRVGNYYDNEEWKDFQETFNQQFSGLVLNRRDAIVSGFSYDVKNFSSFVPMPYLMSMLRNPIANNGYKVAGSFVENPFNNRIVVVPKENNNNTSFLVNSGISFSLNDSSIIVINDYYNYVIPYSNLGIGLHKIEFNLSGISEPSANGFTNVRVYRSYNNGSANEFLLDEEITEFNISQKADYLTSLTVDVTDANINDSDLFIQFGHSNNILPEQSLIKIKPEAKEQNLHLIHPTVDLSRFVPDWTIGTLLNNLKNWQNLEIIPDEVSQTIVINYNEEFLFRNDYVDLSGFNIKITDKGNSFKNKHKISYANDEDSVLIENGSFSFSSVETSDTVVIKNKFKAIVKNDLSNQTSKEFLQSEGVNLALNASPGIINGLSNVFVPSYITESYQGQSLSLLGEYGIINNFWLKWINFRQKAKSLLVSASIDDLTLSFIKNKRKIYFDNRMYAVKSFTNKVRSKLNDVVFELENIVPSIGVDEASIPLQKFIFITASSQQNYINGTILLLPWEIKVNYNYINFSSFAGTLYLRQLDELGQYTGEEMSKAINTISGTETFVFPQDITGLTGSWEVSLVDNDITSNLVKVEINEPVFQSESITITEVEQPNVVFFEKIIFNVTYNNFTPNSGQIFLQKFDSTTQLNIGNPIATSIADINDNQFTVDLPSSGSWKVYIVSEGFTSNTLSKFSIQF